MNFQDLHELLRIELLRRIERGELTGTRLAQQAGFRQAHISNFLNRKRALSLEGLDRVMAAQSLTIDQIVPLRVDASADRTALFQEQTHADANPTVPVVNPSTALDQRQIRPADVIELAHVSATRLSENRTRVTPRQAGWQRFVAIRAVGQDAAAMHPTLAAGTIAVIDRHYNSIAPYRSDQPTLLAIRYGSSLLLRFVEQDGGRLILRPSAIEYPLLVMTLGANETASEYILGRVCLLLHEL